MSVIVGCETLHLQAAAVTTMRSRIASVKNPPHLTEPFLHAERPMNAQGLFAMQHQPTNYNIVV